MLRGSPDLHTGFPSSAEARLQHPTRRKPCTSAGPASNRRRRSFVLHTEWRAQELSAGIQSPVMSSPEVQTSAAVDHSVGLYHGGRGSSSCLASV